MEENNMMYTITRKPVSVDEDDEERRQQFVVNILTEPTEQLELYNQDPYGFFVIKSKSKPKEFQDRFTSLANAEKAIAAYAARTDRVLKESRNLNTGVKETIIPTKVYGKKN
jgi:hypothetical protein